MASKTFSGQLDQAMNEAAAEGNKILFIPQQTVGEVLPGAASELVVESDGTYSIKLAYNTYSIYHYSDVTKRKTLLATDIVVSTDTAVTTIPDLLGSVVPVTEDSVLTIQGYLDEANEAKTDAETAQAATEALFDDFDSSVADSMSLVYTDTPSLSIPFNESGRLDYGVGTEYVSGLPVYGVDFTRSTTSTVINKSGVLETLAADEVGIGVDGAWLHDSYTNNVLYSNDFTQSDWIKSNCTVTDDGTYASTGLKAYLLEFTDGVAGFIRQAASSAGAGFLWIKGAEGEALNLDVRAVDNSVVNLLPVTLTGEWQRINTLSIYDSSDYDGVTSVYAGIRFNSGNTATSVYISQFDLVDTEVELPPIITTSSTASTVATSCSLPASGNLPDTGESFTIVFDAEFPVTDANYTVFSINSDISGGSILFRKNNAKLQWFHDQSDGSDASLLSSNTDYTVGRHRYSLAFDGSTFAMYCDGDFINSRTTDDFCWFDMDGKIYLTSSYNNQLKNFKILPYAASADEVKSWGAPK